MEKSIIHPPVRIRPFLRTMWFFWAAVVLAIIILNVPSQINMIAVAMQSELIAPVPSWMVTTVNIATIFARSAGSLISLALAGVLFFKRPEDGMALFLSYFLLVIGVVLMPLSFLEPIWAGANTFTYRVLTPLILGPFLVAFLSTFPNGHFAPSWTRWLVTTVIIYAPASLILFSPENYAEPTPIYIVSTLIWFALILSAFYAQIYRYRHVSNSIERQQTKWVIYGFALSALFVVLTTIWRVYSNSQPQFTPLPWWSPIITLGWVLAFATLPIALTFAVMRYRLYDIDIVINRTLVYGALTGCVFGLYVLVVGGAGLVIQTNVNLIGLLITAALAVVIVRLVRDLLQQGVDRLMYGKDGASPTPPKPQAQLAETAESLEDSGVHNATPWLKIAHLAWYPTALLAFGIYLAAVPGLVIIGTGGVTDPRFSPNPSPIIDIISWFALIIAISISFGSLFLSLFLFRRRSDDRMALLTSFFLLAYSVIVTGTLEALEPFVPGIAFFNNSYLIPLFQPFILLLFAVFPDGRFVPRWIRWVVVVAFLNSILSLFWTTRFGEQSFNYSDPGVIILVGLNVLLVVIGWICIIYAQIYRYRRVSNIQQKQQTKWILYGLGLLLTTQAIISIPWAYSFSLPPGSPYPIWLVASTLIWLVSIAIVPLTLTIAVMRYRLFEIDFIINRSLMYGALTIIIVVIYILVVGSLGTFFQSQGNLIIALLATGIVAVLFQPLRARLQEGMNRVIYGERDDPVETLSRLGKQLETAVPPDDVLPMLVETIAQTLKLPYVAIQIPAEKEGRIAAEFGAHSQEATSFPLIYQGETIGRLVVASRSPGNSFSPAEMRLLRNIARQAGAAVHAIQLTIDLQRSRQHLVTAREEERRRLRRDLHDGLGATLAAINLEVGALKRAVRSDPEKAESIADELRQDIRGSIDNIRHLVYELRPPTLDQLGLVEAVRTQARKCSRVEANGDLSLQVRVEAPESLPQLPAAVEVAAYRITQEAMTNVVHHAQAQHCTVRLEMTDELKVEVIDDGIGIGKGRQSQNGLGLLSMRERAEELGGLCLIEPNVGGGTHVVASLPLLEV